MKKSNNCQNTRMNKLTKLQPLQLERLDQIVGGHHGPIMCPDCNDLS